MAAATKKSSGSKSSSRSKSTTDKVAKTQTKEAEELKELQIDVHHDNVTNVPTDFSAEVREDIDPDKPDKQPALLASVQTQGNVLVVDVPKSPLRLEGEQARAFLRHFAKAGASI